MLITSRKNALLTHYRKLGAKDYRYARGEFLLDGRRLLEDALACGYPVKTVLLTQEAGIQPPKAVRTVYTTADIMDGVSPLEAPQGVLFTCPIPDCGLPERFEGNRYIVLDGVRDPGNVGTVIRSAEAFGMDGVILTADCADPFGIKTARATMGGIFRQRIYIGERGYVADALRRSDIPVFAAAIREDAVDIRELDLTKGALIIGNEGAGISDEMLSIAGAAFRIPMNGACQSLNAAVSASVIMWEMCRSR